MINTYNESPLHETLKKLYALEYDGEQEQAVGTWICDIVTKDGGVIEIQTTGVSKLARKTEALLAEGRRVTIVHPIVAEKTIETYDADGSLISRRKSPKRATIYSLFRELTGIYPLLLRDGFKLEVLLVALTERRQKMETPVQLANKSRRFLKDWVPLGKRLDEIREKRRFAAASDYTALLPAELPMPFSAPQLAKALEALPALQTLSASNRRLAAGQARLMIWLYTRMGLIESAGKQGRSNVYTIPSGVTPSCQT